MMLTIALYFVGNVVFPYLGIILATLLCSFQDSFGVGQSIGKKIIGLRVIDDVSGASCSLENSFFRNLPFALILFFSGFPVLWGLSLILVVPTILLEIYLVYSLDTGVRVGDIMGNTLVTEYHEEQWDGA